jgi:carbon monoxide dehydrogenase subunit G
VAGGRLLERYVSVMRVEESIEIARTPQEVWDLISDPMNDPRWCPKVKSVTPAGQATWTVIHKPVPLRPPIELTVVQQNLEAPSRLSMREEDESSTFEVEYRLEPTATGTRFTQISEIEWKKLPRFLYGTFERGVHRDLRNQLKSLKSVLER